MGQERQTAREQSDRRRLAIADLADEIARVSEELSASLEVAAGRGDAGRRLAIAEWERGVAAVERENAARLRSSPTGPLVLKRLPPFPGPSN